MSKTYSIAQARQNLPKLVHEAEAGASIELTRRGKPVAVVLSFSEYQRLTGQRPDFMANYRAWREEHDIDNLDLDPDGVFNNLRDPSPGREFSWDQ
jgi:prevent-host-death family protein